MLITPTQQYVQACPQTKIATDVTRGGTRATRGLEGEDEEDQQDEEDKEEEEEAE